jgi:hypothetical protein
MFPSSYHGITFKKSNITKTTTNTLENQNLIRCSKNKNQAICLSIHMLRAANKDTHMQKEQTRMKLRNCKNIFTSSHCFSLVYNFFFSSSLLSSSTLRLFVMFHIHFTQLKSIIKQVNFIKNFVGCLHHGKS